MKHPALKKLLELMNDPEQLRLNIEQLRGSKNLDTSILGFIAMYDSFNGDCEKLKEQIASNKNSILKPIAENKKTLSRFYLRKIAAIFVLIVSSSYLIYSYFITPQLELSPRYTDPGIPIFMGTNSNLSLDQIMYSYRKKDYTSALHLIEKESISHSNNDTLIYYTALVHHYLKNDEKALFYFKQLENKTSKFTNKAHYFRGLSAINLCNYNQAIQEFKVVCNSSDDDNDDLKSLSCAHILAVKQYLQSKSTHTSK